MMSQPPQNSKIGFYFHIPFCPHICPYCDFVKTSQFTKKDTYVYQEKLIEQLKYFLNILNCKDEYATVYFGGGTPGIFEASFYEPILHLLKKKHTLEEITIETNPLLNLKRKIFDYKKIGFDRITLGAQSLCENTLQTLGRKHSADTVLKNIEWARAAGITQVQVDLIYGLKNDIRSLSVEHEIETLFNAGATGISAYALTLEQRTLFANSDLAHDEVAYSEYLQILNKCTELGLAQKETSNFSMYETKHNNLYWYGMPYIGIGTGAHGLLPAQKDAPYGTRYRIGQENYGSHSPGNDKLKYAHQNEREKNFAIKFENPRSKSEYVHEMIFTLLRTPHGIPFDWLIKVTSNSEITKNISQQGKIKRAIQEGKIHLDKQSIFLDPSEKIRGDAWALEFISLLSL